MCAIIERTARAEHFQTGPCLPGLLSGFDLSDARAGSGENVAVSNIFTLGTFSTVSDFYKAKAYTTAIVTGVAGRLRTRPTFSCFHMCVCARAESRRSRERVGEISLEAGSRDALERGWGSAPRALSLSLSLSWAGGWGTRVSK